jgi:hypothetical protein
MKIATEQNLEALYDLVLEDRYLGGISVLVLKTTV